MARKNRTRSSNGTNLDCNESSDEDGCCSPRTTRPISTGLLTSNQQQTAHSQSAPVIQSNNAEQSNINQQIHGYPYVHHNSLYRQNYHGVQLGHSGPSNENSSLRYSLVSSQIHLPAEHVDCPMDERVRWMDNYHFSLTIKDSFTYFRESECIENTQEHSMPLTIILNNIGSNQIANGENNRMNMDVITQNNPDKNATSLWAIGIPTETTVANNAVAAAPNEIPQDTDFSVITSETKKIDEISMHSSNDEQSLIRDSFVHVGDNDELSHSNNQIVVEASPNNTAIANVVPPSASSNQMNNADEQSAGTELTNNTSSPETLEIARDVATNEATPQAILCVTNIPVKNVEKLLTAFEPSNDLNKEIRP
ncbi:unnamed protein product [Rotaria sp. Silwood1]|nr:unnamed protein product [Rotaria sp. Silwood1]